MTALASGIQFRGLVFVLLWTVIVTGTGSAAPDSARTGETPLNASIHDLVERPDDYEGRLVLVTGYVGRVAWERGRRGSEYVELRLDEAGTASGATEASVTVVAWPAVAIKKCEYVLVQGVFHRSGNQAGRPYELFIEADAVLRDDPADPGRVPSACDKEI
jgi:hypothetical protein